jgi:hypothetical protein
MGPFTSDLPCQACLTLPHLPNLIDLPHLFNLHLLISLNLRHIIDLARTAIFNALGVATT